MKVAQRQPLVCPTLTHPDFGRCTYQRNDQSPAPEKESIGGRWLARSTQANVSRPDEAFPTPPGLRSLLNRPAPGTLGKPLALSEIIT